MLTIGSSWAARITRLTENEGMRKRFVFDKLDESSIKTRNLPSDTSETVDTDVDWLDRVDSGLAVDDISELRLEGSTSDQETIDILLGGELWGVLAVGRSTVEDTGVGSNLSTGNLANVLTDSSVSILSLLWGSGQTSSNGPDWFVSDNNLGPVLLGENIGISLDLREDEVVGGTSLTAFLWLTAASHDGKTRVDGVLGLGGTFFVRLALLTTLGVTGNSPLDTHIGQHLSRSLSGEGTLSLGPDILGTDRNVGADLVLDTLQVHLGWADNNLSLRGEGALVEHADKVVHLGHGTIALPVSSNEELAGLSTSSGRVCAVIDTGELNLCTDLQPLGLVVTYRAETLAAALAALRAAAIDMMVVWNGILL